MSRLKLRIGTTKAFFCAWMAGNQEFSAVVVKACKNFFQMYWVPDGESGQGCGVLELVGRQYGAGPDF
tara:strand:+ start:306 stop:509 length:204 start_codon:yes stop_codon:yes gene_type:complete